MSGRIGIPCEIYEVILSHQCRGRQQGVNKTLRSTNGNTSRPLLNSQCPTWSVVELPWEGVLWVMRHVIVHHDDDVVVRVAAPLEHLGTEYPGREERGLSRH